MREKPTTDSRVVSQAIFSEEVTLVEINDGWASINTADGYSGWVLSSYLINLSKPFDAGISTSRLKTHIYSVNDTEYGPVITLPFGSKLKVLDILDSRWLKVSLPDGLECYVQSGDVATESELQHKSELYQFSQRFLGLPYTWGGRSSFGYDCSGFVQMLYNRIGVSLQRDAKQQIVDSRLQEIDVNDLEIGDLVFFGKSAQKIMHVGLYIGDGQFIHATSRENKPWLRISYLTDFEWSGDEKAYYPYRTARQLIDSKD